VKRLLGCLLVLAVACARDRPVGRTVDAGPLRVSSVPLDDPDDVVSEPAARAVVDSHRAELVRRCWDPLAGRADGPAVAHVTVRVTSRFDGTTGEVMVAVREPSARALGPCVQREVEAWRFPSAEEATRLTIPLAFAR
jgi:hypothetical protein